MQSIATAAIHLLLLLSHPATCCRQRASFHAILTSNCVSPAYYQLLNVGPDLASGTAVCAARCRDAPRCRAFAMEAAASSDQQLCLLFAFDACSSQLLLHPSSWSSGCTSRRLRVFVKQSEGLEPGRLCPADYRWVSGVSGSRFKGSLYKAAGNGQVATWSAQADSCRSFLSSSDGSGMPLTKLADLSSVEELKDVRSSTGLTDGDQQIWVSASALSNGSWAWTDCGWPLPLVSSSRGGLWAAGEPSDGSRADIRARISKSGLYDKSYSNEFYGACECVDPFSYFTSGFYN